MNIPTAVNWKLPMWYHWTWSLRVDSTPVYCVSSVLMFSGLPRWHSAKEPPPCQFRRHKRHGFDPLEEEMATYSSILAWKIPWTEELWFLILKRWSRSTWKVRNRLRKQTKKKKESQEFGSTTCHTWFFLNLFSHWGYYCERKIKTESILSRAF